MAMATDARFRGGSAWLLLPVAGPWGALGSINNSCQFGPPPNDCNSNVLPSLLIFDGVGQAVGAGLIALGMLAPKTERVRDDSTIVIVPSIARDTAGITVMSFF
jgi:hypothetical protein